VFMPWLVAIGGWPGVISAREPHAWKVWSAEFLQFGTGRAANTTAGTKAELSDPVYYYVQMLVWIVPFTPTLIAGLFLPFLSGKSQAEVKPSAVERRGRWLMWLVLVGGLLMLSVPSEKKPRYALQLFPFAALLCATVWQEFMRWNAEKKLDLGGKAVLAAQGLFFLLPGLAGMVVVILAAFMELPKWLGGKAVGEAIHAASVPLALLLLIALSAAAWIFWRLMARGHLRQAGGLLPLCGFVFLLAMQTIYKSAPSTHTSTVREPVANAMAKMPAGAGVFTLTESRPWLPTLYFANHVIEPRTPEQLAAWAHESPTKDLCLVLITDEWVVGEKKYVPMQHLEEDLIAIERLSGRQRRQDSAWTDENRHTGIVTFPAAAPK